MSRRAGAWATVTNIASTNGSDKCFEKTMKKTLFRTMGVPSWFVRAYGNEFTQNVGVSYKGRDLKWEVRLNVSTINNLDHVTFQNGWREFAHFHGIEEGERLKFTLAGFSHFVVEHAAVEES